MEPMTAVPTTLLPIASIVQITTLVVLLIVIIFGVILYYHWEQYAIDARVKFITYTSFFLIAAPLLLAIGLITFLI